MMPSMRHLFQFDVRFFFTGFIILSDCGSKILVFFVYVHAVLGGSMLGARCYENNLHFLNVTDSIPAESGPDCLSGLL